MAMENSKEIAEIAQGHVLLVAMVSRMVVELAHDLPMHGDRRDAVLDDQVLLFRSRRVEEHRFVTQIDPVLVAFVLGDSLAGGADGPLGIDGWPPGPHALHGSSIGRQ